MNRGEVRWFVFPKPDKRRPVVVLTRNSIVDSLGEVTVAPITRTIRGIPSQVVLGPEHGLSEACAVNCDHIQTVQKKRLGALITRLDVDTMAEVGRAVAFALDLPLEPLPELNSIF